MTRSIWGARRAAAVLTGTAAATTLLLSGCGAGQHAETAAKVPTSVGANAQSADNNFKVRNLSIDYLNTTGYPADADAPLNVALYNDSGETVTVKITAEGARSVVLTGPSPAPVPAGTVAASPTPSTTAGSPTPDSTAGSPTPGGSAAPTEGPSPTAAAPQAPAEIRIPPAGFVILNKAGGSWLQITGLEKALPPGGLVPMTFDFGGTPVTVSAPVAVPFTPAPVGTPLVGEGEGEEGHGG